jgi:phenylacetate-CoA ligase
MRTEEAYPVVLRRLVLPALTRLTNVRIWDEYKQGMRVEDLRLDQLRDHQLKKLREILSHASGCVPFYRERFREIGLTPGDIQDLDDLLRIPPTTKEDVMMGFPEGITAEGMDRKGWKYVATSGTTRQIMGIHDRSKTVVNWAAGLRAHKLAGNHDVGKRWMEIPPHMCTNICGINDSREKESLFSRKGFSLLLKGNWRGFGQHSYDYFHGRRQDIYRRVSLPSFGSEGTNLPEEELRAYLRSISEYEPYLLEGLPLYLYALAKFLAKSKMAAPRVGVIKPFGGSMTPRMREVIREGFDCPVFDTYGCSEMGFIACDCEKHDGLHLFMDLYHVEVCRNGKLAEPGELGKLYITDLTNRAMPWIRYDVGDVGRYFLDDHGCGRKSMRLQVEGRVEDTLTNSMGEFFTNDRTFDFFHGLKEVDNFQLVEKAKGVFDLLLVPREGDDGFDKERIAAEFRSFFDANASVKAFTVKSIKAEDGGKFRFVKSRSFGPIAS